MNSILSDVDSLVKFGATIANNGIECTSGKRAIKLPTI